MYYIQTVILSSTTCLANEESKVDSSQVGQVAGLKNDKQMMLP